MKAAGVEVLLVDTPENITYLTGFCSGGYYMYTCAVVPIEGDVRLVVRHAELGNARASTWVENLSSYDDTVDPISAVADQARSLAPPKKTAVEMSSSFLTAHRLSVLTNQLGCSPNELVDGSAFVLEERKVKSSEEVTRIRSACKMASEGMRAAVEAVDVGRTENDVAAAIFASLIGNGCEFLAMEPYVNTGRRTGIVHASWSGQRIAKGDPVLIEIAGCDRRYHGALMRTVLVGAVPTEVREWAKVANGALEAAIEAIRPGVTSGEVDAACRSVVEAAGLYERFRKRTGYSIGLAYAPDWGEGHFLGLQKDDPTVLVAGMVFHMPPAIRQLDMYGFGLSETVLVTESGCDVLTVYPERFVEK
jgi:Xaa-Pro dipeptidase